MHDILLIYPWLGTMDTMVSDPPLSILYAAAESVKKGYRVELLDLRVDTPTWEEQVRQRLDEGVGLVGLSVMTGMPLRNAREVSRFVKKHAPAIPIVWGGPHVTVVPETIEEPYIDYLIRGYGSTPLAGLCEHLKGDDVALSSIAGLSYKQDGEAVHNQRSSCHEFIPYTELPYHLIDMASPLYTRAYRGKKIFPIFSALGCPYTCAFCMHPAVYKVIQGAKWQPYSPEEVVAHIQFLVTTYKADAICFYDDTSFPDLERMRFIFQLIIDKGLNLTLEFRGARINEIIRMDESFFELMVKAGTRILMVGLESASPRILKNMKKGITVEQICEANRMLARHPEITPMYSLVYGTPGEQYEDLIATKDVILRILRENPSAYVAASGDWRPIPGTRMLQIAQEDYGYVAPRTLDDWVEVDMTDSETKAVHPWYTPRHDKFIRLMQVTAFVIDDKLIRESKDNNSLGWRVIRMLSRLYRPVAMFRLKYNIHQLLIEYPLWRLGMKAVAMFKSSFQPD